MSVNNIRYLVFLLLTTTATACAGRIDSSIPDADRVIAVPASEMTAAPDPEETGAMVSSTETVGPELEPPPFATGEIPLQASLSQIPDVWIVPARQSKSDLAKTLHTTVDQLEWSNPGLEDPVPAGTLVAVPLGYRAFDVETLSSISDSTGVPLGLLEESNPNVSPEEPLAAGTVLQMPSLHFVQEPTLLSAAADALNLTDEQLLSANPDMEETLREGTILLVPPVPETE